MWAFSGGHALTAPDARSNLTAAGGPAAPAAPNGPAEKVDDTSHAVAAAQPAPAASAATSTPPSGAADEQRGTEPAATHAPNASKPAATGKGRAPETPGLVTGEPASKPSARIDTQAASAALSEAAANARSCKSSTSPSGVARVSVTFTSTGQATSAYVAGAPFAGTLEGKCIAAKFRAAQIPPYSGDDVTLRKNVDLQ
jgi:hypothetical protein